MKDGQQAMFHPGGNSNNATPSPGRVEKNVHSPWTAPRDRKKHRRAHSSGLPEVDEEALQPEPSDARGGTAGCSQYSTAGSSPAAVGHLSTCLHATDSRPALFVQPMAVGMPGADAAARKVQSCNWPSQAATPVPPIILEACSTDFAGTVGKKAPFQAAFYFGTGLVVPAGADTPFGPGPLAAGAQCFSGIPSSCSQAAPDQAADDAGTGKPAAQSRGSREEGARSAACRERAILSTRTAPAGSPAVASQRRHSSSPLLLSPEGSAMDVCTSSGRRLGGHGSGGGGLTPLIGRSIEKLRRSWGSSGGSGSPLVKELLMGGAAAREADAPLESISSAMADLDMQPLMHGHLENLCPNSGSSAVVRLGPPQRSPLGEIHLHQGGEVAAAAWGAQRVAQHVQQQHRLARAGGQAEYKWAAAGAVAYDSGADMQDAAAVPGLAKAVECSGRLAQLHAVMHMSSVDASVDGSAVHSEAVQLELYEEGPCHRRIALAQWQEVEVGSSIELAASPQGPVCTVAAPPDTNTSDSSRGTAQGEAQAPAGLARMQSCASMGADSCSSARFSPCFEGAPSEATPRACAAEDAALAACSQASNGELAPWKPAGAQPAGHALAGEPLTTFNDRLHEAVVNGDAVTVGQAWQEVQAGAIEPDIDALNLMLKARCRVSGDPSPKEAEELYAHARKRGVLPNDATYRALAAIQVRHEQLGAL